MFPPGDPSFHKRDKLTFGGHVGDDDGQSQSRSASSSVSEILNNLSSLTYHENPSNLLAPLNSNKLENIQPNSVRVASTSKSKADHAADDEFLTSIQGDLLAKYAQQKNALNEQGGAVPQAVKSSFRLSFGSQVAEHSASSSQSGFRDSNSQSPGNRELEEAQRKLDDKEMELSAANETIARQAEEIHNQKVINLALDSTRSGPEFGNCKVNQFKSFPPRPDTFEDAKSDVSEPMSSFSRGINAWDSVSQVGANPVAQQNIWSTGASKTWGNRRMVQGLPPLIMPHQVPRNFAPPVQAIPQEGSQFYGNPGQFQFGHGMRQRNNGVVRGRGNPWSTAWNPTNVNGLVGMNVAPYQATTTFTPAPNYETRSTVTSTLSAMAPEFTLGGNHRSYSGTAIPGQSYASSVEPLNYRKLLDRSVSCNWKYIVDKIICSNDQQASIFLQQKLKVGTAEQKFEIVEAIVAQAYPLMVNRFGNFLVQRCFEHGTPGQVVAIANAIRGNTLSLSMDAFGCHVVQKAFDAVPEEYKAIMVHELLRRIPETVIHRYACHVWQKLFELRWSDSPPQIMKYVNEALRGMWHEVALGETGSLVVQNIFENCLEDDKRPCIEEVLKSIDIVAHGQFGNWCIQHICEHGQASDRSRAIDHVLRYATEYSMDQFASKVVEKCLKIGGSEFLEHYLDRVCEGRSDRPRIPLIDIASDQYGNYLIQYILTSASSQHREIVAAHIRKHMVSLRGSKFGSRVGLLCCNPAYATRPGPGVSVPSLRFNNSNSGPNNITNSAGNNSGDVVGNTATATSDNVYRFRNAVFMQ